MRRVAPFLLAAAAALSGLQGCASAAARAPAGDGAIAPTVAHPSSSLPPALAELLAQRDRALIAQRGRCATGGACLPATAPELVAPVDAPSLLAIEDGHDGATRRAIASLARALVDDALAPEATERSQKRRALTFRDNVAVFALDDLPTLLAQAPRAERSRLLTRAAAACDAATMPEERERMAEAARALGLTRAELLARRAGVDAATLRGLIDSALVATGPLLGPVAADATLVPDVRSAATSKRRRAASAAELDALVDTATMAADPVLLETLAMATHAPRSATRDDVSVWLRALVLELRIAALSALALLDDADAAAADALASRALASDAAMVPGARCLLDREAGGRAVERFTSLLLTPAVVQASWSGASSGDVAQEWLAAPPLEQRGFPEAFTEVVTLLPELAGR